MNTATHYFIHNPVDGVLGLGGSTNQEQNEGAYRFMKNLSSDNQHFTVYQKKESKKLAQKTGILSLGESDATHCSESAPSFPLGVGSVEWKFQLKTVTIGNIVTNNHREAIFYPSLDTPVFPLSEFLLIAKEFNAKFNVQNGLFYTECKKDYPNVILRNGSAQVVIPGYKLIDEIDNKCRLNVDFQTKVGGEVILSNNILDDYCVKYNLDQSTVEFLKAH